MKRKTISLLLAVFMLLSMAMPTTAYAAKKDYTGHWAEETIQLWLNEGRINGYPDGTFNPDGKVTRAEFVTMVNKLFNFTETTKISFNDVNKNDWFYKEVQKAFEAGYITGVSETQFAPNSNLTREQAAVIIARLLKLKGDAESAEVFKDMNKISSWALKFVGAAAKAEIIKGYTSDKTFRPQNSITRAEAVVTLNRTIESKDLTIDESDTVVKDKTVRNLYITKDVGNGEVTLKNVTVNGELLVEGGGLNTVTIEDSKINKLTINKKDGKVRILLKGDSEVDFTSILSGATLEQRYLTGDGFNDVVVEEDVNNKQTVTIKADIKELSFKATIKVNVITGEIESLIIDDEAEGLVIDLGNDVKVLSAELNAKVSFKGNGTIKRVEVNADGVTFEKKPTKMIVATGVKQPKIITPPRSNDDSHQDNLKIAAAKIAIEGTTYTATQAEAPDANAALTKAQSLVNELGTELKETKATVVAGIFTAATAGNASTPTGTNGSYTFTVTINKGEGTQVITTNLTMIITATPYDSTAQDNLDIAATKVAIEGATYTATQATVTDATAAWTKAQSLVNALGTQLKGTTATVVAGTFTAATAGDASTPAGTNGSYTFTVTINKGTGTQATSTSLTMTIISTPYNSTAQDNLDIAEAKTAIEGATYTATQATVTDATEALTKAQSLVDALGTELKETKAKVVAGTFIAATAGDASTPAGTNGSYTFTVTINKGTGTQATSTSLTMTITATPYDSTAQDILDVAAAKTAIVGAVYTSTQAEASDATAAMTKAQSLVDALGTQLKGTTATVSSGSFMPAVAGNALMPTGMNGTYMFTVTVSKGTETQVINILLTMTITATPYITVTGVTIDLAAVPDLEVGTGATKTSQQLNATVSPANATDKSITWNSSNDAVATVDTNGLVTAVGAGNATITVTTINGSFTAASAVTVTDVTPTQYTLTLTGAKISSTPAAGLIDENTSVTVTVSPAEGQMIEYFMVDGVDKKAELTANEYNFTITKDTTINATVKLALVENLTWADNVINWVDIDDELEYAVSIYKDGSLLSSHPVAANSTSYDCSTQINSNGSGTYSVSVRANANTANGFNHGDFSALSAPKIVNNATFTGAVWDNSTLLLTINLKNVNATSDFDLTKLSYFGGNVGIYTLTGLYNRVYNPMEVEGTNYGKYFFDGANQLIINLTEADFNAIYLLPDNAISGGPNAMSDTISSATGWNIYNSVNAEAVNSQNVSIQ